MKISLIFAAVFALTTSAALAQTTPQTGTTTPQTGTMNNGTMGSGTNGTMSNGTMNSTTDRMGSMNGTDRSTMRNNKRMSKKGMKTKTDSDGSMKTKM